MPVSAGMGAGLSASVDMFGLRFCGRILTVSFEGAESCYPPPSSGTTRLTLAVCVDRGRHSATGGAHMAKSTMQTETKRSGKKGNFVGVESVDAACESIY